MKIVHTGDPGILSLRSDVVGCVVLAGLLFIAGGGLTAAFALGMIPIEASLEPDLKNIVLAAGAIGVILGLIFVGGRSGKIFDSRRQSLISWSGFLVPMRRKHQRLDGYSWVVLAKEVRRGKNSSTTLFPLRLEGDRGPALAVDACTDPLEARRLAEAVAKVMRLPLTDSTSGEAVIRDPDHLDESLRDRMHRLGERVEVWPQPHSMRSRIQLTSSEVMADLPGMSTKARLIINVVVIVFALGIGMAFFGADFLRGFDGRSINELPLLLVPLFFVGIPLAVVLTKLGKFNQATRVTANRVSVTVVQGRKTTEIPGDELEELSISGLDINQAFQTQADGSLVIDPSHLDTPDAAAYTAKHGQSPTIPPALAGIVRTLGTFSPDSRSILARSDHASVRFGGGLDSEELAYLYSVIMKVMVD